MCTALLELNNNIYRTSKIENWRDFIKSNHSFTHTVFLNIIAQLNLHIHSEKKIYQFHLIDLNKNPDPHFFVYIKIGNFKGKDCYEILPIKIYDFKDIRERYPAVAPAKESDFMRDLEEMPLVQVDPPVEYKAERSMPKVDKFFQVGGTTIKLSYEMELGMLGKRSPEHQIPQKVIELCLASKIKRIQKKINQRLDFYFKIQRAVSSRLVNIVVLTDVEKKPVF